jgi:hypothetical protein
MLSQKMAIPVVRIKVSHNDGGNGFKLPVSIGMLAISRLLGLFHKDLYRNVIDHIGRGIDAICQ